MRQQPGELNSELNLPRTTAPVWATGLRVVVTKDRIKILVYSTNHCNLCKTEADVCVNGGGDRFMPGGRHGRELAGWLPAVVPAINHAQETAVFR